jgi:hypothetical protein
MRKRDARALRHIHDRFERHVVRALGWQPEIFASPRMRIYGTLGNPDFVAAWLCATLPLWTGRAGKDRREWA